MLVNAPTAVQDIVRRHQTRLPVNVAAIAKDLGLSVFQSDALPPKVSGKLFKDGQFGGTSGWTIMVRKGEALTRQRFTVAHEIAHFVLHRNLIVNGVLQDDEFYRSGLSSQQETEANRMAADILMPYDAINRLMNEGVVQIDRLASELKVSQPALKIRLGIPLG
jgi:hypothetical protein